MLVKKLLIRANVVLSVFQYQPPFPVFFRKRDCGNGCQKQPFADVLQNRFSQKVRNIHRKTHVLESLFDKVADLKRYSKLYHVFVTWSRTFQVHITQDSPVLDNKTLCSYTWIKVFKNGSIKICERQPLKKFIWSIHEYLDPYTCNTISLVDVIVTACFKSVLQYVIVLTKKCHCERIHHYLETFVQVDTKIYF